MLHAGIPSPWPVIAGGGMSSHPVHHPVHHHPVVPGMGGQTTEILLHHHQGWAQGGRGTTGVGSGITPSLGGMPPDSNSHINHHQVHHPTPSYSLMGHLTTGHGGYPPLPGPVPPVPPTDNRYHLSTTHQPPTFGPPSFYNGNYAAGSIGSTAGTPPNGIGGVLPPHSSHHSVVRSLSRQSQDGNGIRHASGSSQTSSHSATPPSPHDIPSYNQHLGIPDRATRQSFEAGGQQQCNNNNNNNNTTTSVVSNNNPTQQQTGNRMGSIVPSNRRDSNLSGSSPAANASGGGGSQSPANHNNSNNTSAAAAGGAMPPTSSAAMGGALSGGNAVKSVGSASTYHSSANVKQEPGSPATGYPSPVNHPRTSIVKQEPKNPNSPGMGGGGGPRAQQGSPTSSSSMPARYPVITTRPSSTFSYPSPQGGPTAAQSGAGQQKLPAAAAPNNNPISPVADFNRYQHNSGGGSKPSPGESQCNSAISSREGTPGPTKIWGADDLSGPAPNVDISRVQVKEELPSGLYDAAGGTTTNEYNHRAKVNLSYPAPTSLAPPLPRSSESSYMSPYHHALPPQVSVPSRCGTTGVLTSTSMGPTLPQPPLPPTSTVLGSGLTPVSGAGPHSTYRSNVGRPPMVVPGTGDPVSGIAGAGGVSHSNVKIGRRPAHLPKVLKFEDHTLPHGWQRKLKQRKHGKQAGRWDVYIYSPCGVKFASRKKLKHFFEKNNLQYDAEQFDFTPYGKHIDNNASARHLSSASSGSNRHSGSPGGVSSPTSSGYPSGCTSNSSSDMMLPLGPTGGGPTSSLHSAYMPPVQYGGFDPMMESPPNANARELPHNHVLNLSQSHLPHPQPTRGLHQRPGPPPAHGLVGGPSFPMEMDNLLNDNLGYHHRASRGDYGALHDSRGEEEHSDESRRDDSERGFMATSMNILSDGTMDMGGMDVYSMYATH